MRKAQIQQLQLELDYIDQFLNNLDVEKQVEVPESEHLQYLAELEYVTNSLNQVYDYDRYRLREQLYADAERIYYLTLYLTYLERKKRTEERQKALKAQLDEITAHSASLEAQLEQIKQDFIKTLSGVFNYLAADVRQVDIM